MAHFERDRHVITNILMKDYNLTVNMDFNSTSQYFHFRVMESNRDKSTSVKLEAEYFYNGTPGEIAAKVNLLHREKIQEAIENEKMEAQKKTNTEYNGDFTYGAF